MLLLFSFSLLYRARKRAKQEKDGKLLCNYISQSSLSWQLTSKFTSILLLFAVQALYSVGEDSAAASKVVF